MRADVPVTIETDRSAARGVCLRGGTMPGPQAPCVPARILGAGRQESLQDLPKRRRRFCNEPRFWR